MHLQRKEHANGGAVTPQTWAKVSTEEGEHNTLERYIRRRIQFSKTEQLSEDTLSAGDSMAFGRVSDIFPFLVA